MLVTHNRVDIDIPHEPGHRMTFRPLSGAELDEAERVATKRVIQMMEGIDLSKLAAPRDVDETDRRRTQYDADTLIRHGVIAWSYEVECNDETKRDLDARTRDWARDIILGMNVRTEQEQGNSVASSWEGASRTNSETLIISDSEA